MMSDTELPRARNVGVLLSLSVELVVEVGITVMGLGELMHLAPGSVIELHSKVSDPLQVSVNGRKIGDGKAVMVKERFGVRMLTLLGRAERIQQLGS